MAKRPPKRGAITKAEVSGLLDGLIYEAPISRVYASPLCNRHDR